MLRGHWHLSDSGQIMWRRAREVGHEVRIGESVSMTLPSEQPPWPPKHVGNDPRPQMWRELDAEIEKNLLNASVKRMEK